jgi:flagella basal body P-ring formation protein FlgA
MTAPFTPTPTPAAPPGLAANGHRSARIDPAFPEAGERLPKLHRPRRPALAAAGVLLVLLCGVTSAALASASDHRVRVLALARPVQAGQMITAADLKVAELSGSGLQALSASGAASVVGDTVTASLPVGTLLNASMLTTAPAPAAGLQLVALAVKPGGIPEQATPGRDVSLIRVAAPSATNMPATVLVARARLISVRADSASGALIASVQVPDTAAIAVAQAAAAGTIVMTLLPVAP